LGPGSEISIYDLDYEITKAHQIVHDVLGVDASFVFRLVQDLLVWLAGLTEIGFWLKEHDVFGNDEHVCALSYMGARRPGLDVETRVVSTFHFRDGRQVERWFFPEDATAWDRIFGLAGA
jgi:hypothetical protein